MKSSEIRSRFLAFFEKRGHAILPSASLVPENDPSVLFNTAGMQPLVPYLMGQKHPLGNRLASCQKCVRTGDLEDIGDNRHFSFFEMLGNWSLGDPASPDGIGTGYFKEEAIAWSYEFLTNKDEGLGLDPARLAVTIFTGDENAPYDQESKDIWMSLGIPEHRIYALPADDNWWSPGDNGPCGPCSEMFYDMQGEFAGQEISHSDFIAHVQQESFIEIWNDVFMEYEKKDGTVIGKLAQKNVDTGAGLERLTAVMQGVNTAYQTDIFEESKKYLDSIFEGGNIKELRVILDHIRTAIFMISDGVIPDKKDQGYVLRRLIRRAMVRAQQHGINHGQLLLLSQIIKNTYKEIYIGIVNDSVHEILKAELDKFNKTLSVGLKKFEVLIQLNQAKISGEDLFGLYQEQGFPLEVSLEEIELRYKKMRGVDFDEKVKSALIIGFNAELIKHQEKSRSGAEQKFKGGLGGTTDKIVRSHTAHHLLLSALRQVLGEHVHQRGSNITDERIRIDFAHDTKMTDEQKSSVEQLVNEWITQDLPMQRVEMPREQAETIGAEMEFGVKYPDMVSVYFIGKDLDSAISKEFCGGPHIGRTGSIGSFKIQKEEASSAGVRRIKAVIE
jgi:alanyl-tRNA synthetase